jgi:diaminopimelate epimerase
MKTVLTVLALLLACACGEKSDVTAKDAAAAVRETLSSARDKDVVKIQVRLEKTEMPTAEELALRKKIEEAIEREEIGRVTVADAGVGHIDVAVEVDSTVDAVPRIRELLETMGVLERATVRVESGSR